MSFIIKSFSFILLLQVALGDIRAVSYPIGAFKLNAVNASQACLVAAAVTSFVPNIGAHYEVVYDDQNGHQHVFLRSNPPKENKGCTWSQSSDVSGAELSFLNIAFTTDSTQDCVNFANQFKTLRFKNGSFRPSYSTLISDAGTECIFKVGTPIAQPQSSVKRIMNPISKWDSPTQEPTTTVAPSTAAPTTAPTTRPVVTLPSI